MYVSTGQGILGNNMFAYCGNNPVCRVDTCGVFWETAFDIATLCLSVADVVKNPKSGWAWLGLAGDVVDLIPFATGVGELAKAGRLTGKVADGLSALSEASDYGIKPYKLLKKKLAGTGLEAHHIIEKRLVKHLEIDTNEMLSVAVTKSEHQVFTNEWRRLYAYGSDYSKLNRNDLWESAQEVYKDYPELIDASWKILFG